MMIIVLVVVVVVAFFQFDISAYKCVTSEKWSVSDNIKSGLKFIPQQL